MPILSTLAGILLGLAGADGDEPPMLTVPRITTDFEPDGDLAKPVWAKAARTRVQRTLRDAQPCLAVATEVRCLWSDRFVYVAFSCPYTRLTVFEPPAREERLGLWDRDVVEVFLGPDLAAPRRYGEYEVAPTNERLDVLVDLPAKDFAWGSGFASAVRTDAAAHVWTAELRIPIASLATRQPVVGTRWRMNLYRSDRAADVFLAWSPTRTPSAHTPERFGILIFGD